MAGFLSTKTKRKDLDDVYDEFSEFSLNYPARKIRRLDAELPPIMEEEDPTIPLSVKHQMPDELVSAMTELGSGMIDADPHIPLNEEKALVLYKPVDNPFAVSPGQPNVSFSVHSDVVNGLKHQAFWPPNPNANAVTVEEIHTDDKAVNNTLALVPWVPSQASFASASHVDEPMEAEEAGCVYMEVEEDRPQGLHQQPQHCLMPQPPQNTSTPIMWSWG